MEGSLKKKIRDLKQNKKRSPRVPSARVKQLMRTSGVLRARPDAIVRVRAHLIEEVARLARCAQTFTSHRHGITINSADVHNAAGVRHASW